MSTFDTASNDGANARRRAVRSRTSSGGRLRPLPAHPLPADLPDHLHPRHPRVLPDAHDGDPITAAQGGRLGPDAARRSASPPPATTARCIVQYLEYLGQIFTGNFGTTISDNRPVIEVLATYGTATFELVFYSLIVAFVVGIPLGLLAAYYRDKPQDAVLRVLAILCYAIAGLLRRPDPEARSSRSGWSGFPSRGGPASAPSCRCSCCRTRPGFYTIDALMTGDPAVLGDVLAHAVLPAIALGLLTAGHLPAARAHQRDRHARDRLRRRGTLARRAASSGCVRKHAYRPALIPIITVIGLQIALLLGGRGAHRDDVRVEGPRLPARASTSRPATSSPCRASSCCSPSSSRSRTSSSTSSRRSSTRG